MCCIFGIVGEQNENFSKKDYKNCLDKLFVLSESRGKEASGFAYKSNKINYLKTPHRASRLVKSKVYNDEINNYLRQKMRFKGKIIDIISNSDIK